jgi:hypothetical protein
LGMLRYGQRGPDLADLQAPQNRNWMNNGRKLNQRSILKVFAMCGIYKDELVRDNRKNRTFGGGVHFY